MRLTIQHFSMRRGILLALLTMVPGRVAAQDISDQARRKIQAILAQKAQLNSGQSKVSSSLVFAAMAARNEAGVATLTDVIPTLPRDGQGRVRVVVNGNITPSLITQIQRMGGSINRTQQGAVQADIPLTMVDTVGGHPDVTSVKLPPHAHTNRAPSALQRTTFQTRNKLAMFIGSVTSQGYVAHGANQAFAANYTGAGVKVGILSDSATAGRVAALIASGDLPANTVVLPGEGGDEVAGVSDEGTAIMEIIHDLAPDAQLYFATAYHSEADFAANIIKLQQAGCKVIVDDVSYSNEGVFQDSVIAQAVNQVVSAGTIYFSSSANSGNLTHGTSGTFEGDFSSGGAVSGPVAALESGLLQNFGTTASPILFDSLRAASPFGLYLLQWSDPLGKSTNDYDFFLLDSTGTTVKGFSADTQNGTQDPIEGIYLQPGLSTSSVAGDRLVVVLYSGSPRALHIDTSRGALTVATSGATYGHNAGLNTVSIAATAWNSAHSGTRAFSGFANPTEVFSSDGPRKLFFQPDGTPITPGNFLFATNGGTTLQKPDLTAADGVFTRTPGFLPFYGTSAAGPHAAAIAALILGVRPDYSPAQVKQAMTATALDTMAPGADRDAGFGIAMALPAVQYALSH